MVGDAVIKVFFFFFFETGIIAHEIPGLHLFFVSFFSRSHSGGGDFVFLFSFFTLLYSDTDVMLGGVDDVIGEGNNSPTVSNKLVVMPESEF